MKNPWGQQNVVKEEFKQERISTVRAKDETQSHSVLRVLLVFLVLTGLVFLQGCTETLVNSGSSGSGGSNSGDSPILEEDSSGPGSSSDTQNAPVVNLPNPNAEPNMASSLITTNDMDGNAVIQAGADAHPANANLLIVNSSEELAKAQQLYQRYDGALGKMNYAFDTAKNKLYSHLVGNAHADDDCGFDGTVVPVNSDGSVTPTPIPDYENGQTLELAYVDLDDCTVGDSTSEIALASVLYTAQSAPGPNALTKNDVGEVYQVAQDDDDTSRVVKFEVGSEGPNMDNVNGANFDTDYGYSRVEGAKDAVYMDDGYHAFMKDDLVDYFNMPTCGLNSNMEYECDLVDSLYDSTAGCDPATGCVPKNVKVREGKVYYGTELDVSTTLHVSTVVPELKDNSNDKIYLFPTAINIQYLRSANTPYTDSSASHPGFKGARFFDVNENPIDNQPDEILSIISDASDEFQLVGRYEMNESNLKPTLLLDMSSLSSPQDLRIYEYQDEEDADDCSNSASWENGSAAILTASTVEFLSYDLKDTNCEEDEFELDPYQDGLHLTHLTGNTINIDGVIDWDLSDDLEKAYVLSKPEGGDAEVTIINLGKKTVAETIDLKDELFAGKDINVSPKSIIYHSDNDGERIMISTDEYKLLMTYELD